MESRSNYYFNILLFVGILLLMTIADMTNKEVLFSETENRILAKKPEFTSDDLWNGAYTEAYESYVTDQFAGRNKWIQLKTEVDILLQRKTLKGVYLGKDNYLIEQHLTQNYKDETKARRLVALQKLVDRFNVQVMLVPTADQILKEKLPAYAPVYNQSPFLEEVEKIAGEGYVNVYEALAGHAQEDIYYRTDHHWTTLGAYHGYLAWAECTGKKAFPYNPEAMETVTETFFGTLHSKLNRAKRADKIQIFSETREKEPQILYDFERTTQSYYEPCYLEGKNKYGFFLDENHGVVDITTGYEGGTLYVIKDSFANCFVPLLAPHYSRIVMLDLRYFHGNLFAFLEELNEEEKTEVLVLYNVIHFLEEFRYQS